MNEIIKPFKDRLKEALEYREMRPVDLCNKTKISQSTMSQYLSGYAEPKKRRLNLIATTLNINPTWLMGLDVPMTYDKIGLNKETEAIFNKINAFEAQLKVLGWQVEHRGCFSWYQFNELGYRFDDEGNFDENGTHDLIGCNGKKCKNCNERDQYYLFSKGEKSFHVSVDDYETFINDVQLFFAKRLSKLNTKYFNKTISAELNNQLNAAHERTDIETAPEDHVLDDNIMDDDSEWE